jgi:DNA replication and repair protein RecF
MSVRLIQLSTHNFRNLHLESVSLDGQRTAVLGSNGVGKTSFLEAIAVLGNLRSFRAPAPRRVVRHGEKSFRLAGVVTREDGEHRLEQGVEIGPPVRRVLLLDGAPIPVAQYLQIYPCFAITGSDRELVAGPPGERRALLDRFVFLLRAGYYDDLRAYRHALRQRNAALAQSATGAEMDAWEQPLAAAASRVFVGRREGVAIISELFAELYRQLVGADAPPVAIAYRGEGWLEGNSTAQEVEDLYRRRYNETRVRDRQAGFTLEGPHRHDMSLRSEGRDARYLLSSGQAKVVAASLRLATLAHLEKERREHFPVIVDDVDAELDRAALDRLLHILGSDRQVLLSSTSEQVAESAGKPAQRIWLDNGRCVNRETELNE